MPVAIAGKKYFHTSEAARMAGISRSTLLRWIETGAVRDESHRDRHGWRLFSQANVTKLQKEASRISV